MNEIYLKNMFKILGEACPCIECLVKVVCLKNRLACEPYLTILTLVNKKGYSSEDEHIKEALAFKDKGLTEIYCFPPKIRTKGNEK